MEKRFTPLKWSELGAQFASVDKAREYIERLRWGTSGAVCPHCGGTDPYTITPRKGSNTRKGLYKCRIKECRKQFTVTVGTVFEDSHIPLNKWLQCLHLVCASKKGISALQVQRMLDLKSYQSAWFMVHRLRYAMAEGPLMTLLKGVIEVDETYVGGRRRTGKGQSAKRGHPGPDQNKTPVLALVERGGRVRAMPMERVTSRNVKAAILGAVDVSNSVLMTDEAQVYTKVGRKFREHEAVKHALGEYVRGAAHTNTVEGFFGLLKRGLNGTFHHVGKGHLWRYCEEFAFRYNSRKLTDAERTGLLMRATEGKRLTYRPLAESLESLTE